MNVFLENVLARQWFALHYKAVGELGEGIGKAAVYNRPKWSTSQPARICPSKITHHSRVYVYIAFRLFKKMVCDLNLSIQHFKYFISFSC